MKNLPLCDQVIFHVENLTDEKNKFFNQNNKLLIKSLKKYEKESYLIQDKRYIKIPITFDEYNKIESVKPAKACFIYLKIHNKAIFHEILKIEYDSNSVYFFSDFKHFLRIEEVVVTNNTEPPGPKVQKPISEAAFIGNPILDKFNFIPPKVFSAAANNLVESSNNKIPYPVVAIIDTGIDWRAFRSRIKNRQTAPLHLYEDPCACQCKPKCSDNNYVIGRNFYDELHPYKMYPNHPFDNDGFTKHGTRMAKIIANVSENKVRIMSLKTANHAGEHNLFDIYSAFEYILEYNDKTTNASDKVKIINASWSYVTTNKPLIMQYYIEKLLSSGVTFVTTAGNVKALINDRYPAMIVEPSDRFLVVTTFDENDNFIHGWHDTYVKYAVNGDNLGKYKNVLKNEKEDEKLLGTSYAAAIVSGYLAKNNLTPPSGSFDRNVTHINSSGLY